MDLEFPVGIFLEIERRGIVKTLNIFGQGLPGGYGARVALPRGGAGGEGGAGAVITGGEAQARC